MILENQFSVKKDTLKISKYEEALLQYYKKYLQKLEKFIAILFKKQGDKRERTEVGFHLIVCSC